MNDIFPAQCHLKVIAVDVAGMNQKLNTVMEELGCGAEPFRPGNRSAKGKYVSYNASVTVENREQMRQIDNALRSISGVKMVF